MLNVPNQNVSFWNVYHTRLRFHLNPSPLHILSSLPSSLPMPNPEAKSNPSKRLPSASLATLIHREGLSIGVHSGFNPHPVSVFFLPHDGDISPFVHLLPPNSTVDKNAPSPLVVFCANSNANATSTTCSSWQPSNQYDPSPTSSTTAVSLYRSVALARIPHSTGHPSSKLVRNLITQKNENLKSADNISTHVMGRARSLQ